MKKSEYNLYHKDNKNNLIVYNTISGGILLLEPEYGTILENLNHSFLPGEILDEDLFNNLKIGGMIVDNDVDELSAILLKNKIMRYSTISAHYTIAPTLDCNFRCPYCYENIQDKSYMTSDVINSIKKKFLSDKQVYKSLNIIWYGGEPLLAFKQIEDLSKYAIECFGEEYSASIVTNGFLLNENIIKKLDDLHISDIQITIDGPPKIHNSRRCLPNGGDTFFTIISNIENLLKLNNKINISIRINVDKSNIDDINELVTFFESLEFRDRINYYLAPVDNINDTTDDMICFSGSEFAKEELGIMMNDTTVINDYDFPSVNYGICGAVSTNSIIIDPCGYLYRCWDDIGNRNESSGRIDDDNSIIRHNSLKWLNYNIDDDKSCMKCKFLPLCMGGCPNYFIKCKDRKCIPLKYNFEDSMNYLLKLHHIKKEKRNGMG